MCTRGLSSVRRAGFTLLEVMIAVVIISLIMVSVYRFVKTTLTAIGLSQTVSVERQELTGLINFVQAQLEDLPAKQPGVLTGHATKYNDLASDEMTWTCRAGQGVLTTSAPDEYRVTLTIQPVEKSTKELEIGLRRQPTNVEEKNYHWLPLIRPAAALEIRYYDQIAGAWRDRWENLDPANNLPSLVRITVLKTADAPPLVAILPVPGARVQNAGVLTIPQNGPPGGPAGRRNGNDGNRGSNGNNAPRGPTLPGGK